MNEVKRINQEIEAERMKFDTSLRRLHELKIQAYEVCEEEYGHDFTDDEFNCSLCGIVNDSLIDQAMMAYDDEYRWDMAINEAKE